VEAVTEVFDADQLTLLVQEARALVERRAADGIDIADALGRLARLEAAASQGSISRSIN
jgi:hypothetical protein